MIGITVSWTGRDARDYYGASALLCPIIRSEISRHWRGEAGPQHSSHVHDMCLKQTDLGYRQTPLMQQHHRVQGSLLIA